MSLYNVIAPCILMVEDTALHYTGPAEAVEIDDAVAAPLVAEGVLEPHGEPAPASEGAPVPGGGEQSAEQTPDPQPESAAKPARRRGAEV